MSRASQSRAVASASPLRTVAYAPPRVPAPEVLARIREDRVIADARRTVRAFAETPVAREVIEEALRIAGSAPSGAHREPWHFVAISDRDTKARIRVAAEVEERTFYETRATPEWLEALAPLGTDFAKEHLTTAPWLIVVFRRDHDETPEGPRKNYYVNESVGIATGFLIQALHRAGLATLTHTPAPMTFLRELCGRPKNEKPFVLLPVGYPAIDCHVPDLKRKTLEEISTFVE
ncbi:MAG: nitroreductase family protein [Deltaproteobacteria bacterium]|nr:nitroreductase family protein [Deltaproteobacteria bacterium]